MRRAPLALRCCPHCKRVHHFCSAQGFDHIASGTQIPLDVRITGLFAWYEIDGIHMGEGLCDYAGSNIH